MLGTPRWRRHEASLLVMRKPPVHRPVGDKGVIWSARARLLLFGYRNAPPRGGETGLYSLRP
jgi:hypothetical protein